MRLMFKFSFFKFLRPKFTTCTWDQKERHLFHCCSIEMTSVRPDCQFITVNYTAGIAFPPIKLAIFRSLTYKKHVNELYSAIQI